MIPNQQVALPDPDPFLAMPAPHVNGAPANPNPPAAHNQGYIPDPQRIEALCARLRARNARQQEDRDMAMALALQNQLLDEDHGQQPVPVAPVAPAAQAALAAQAGQRHVRLKFVNNVKRPVDILWKRRTRPDIPIGAIDTVGNLTWRKYTKYSHGTCLIFKWNSDGQPQEQMTIVNSSDGTQEIHIGESEEIQWKHAALKLDYLMKEIIRMGASNETRYPNLAPIVDMHQDIHLPNVTERDKETAGIPSALTNIV